MKNPFNRSEPYVSTTNACKLCKPLGACLAFKGIEGAVPFLHGSQGCATYMRRYIISHYREPMDIASSSLGEKHAVYGGGPNLKLGLKNVVSKYKAGAVGIATTCLTETIGDDVPLILEEFRRDFSDFIEENDSPNFVNVSTPSFAGTHIEGFHAAVKATVQQVSIKCNSDRDLVIFPGFVSPADSRYLREVVEDFGLETTILPDLSLSLDGPALTEYENLPSGGTPISEIAGLAGVRSSVEFGRTLREDLSAGYVLNAKFGIPHHLIGIPIGLRESDTFFELLHMLSGNEIPAKHNLERGRLIDSYVDGHKYVFEKRALIYGDPDLVVGLTAFLVELGIKPVMCATGTTSPEFSAAILNVIHDITTEKPAIRDGVDFHTIAEEAADLEPEIIVGNSKGYHFARKWNVPLIRVGFPIHDRFGGQRILHLGYRGAQILQDLIVNTIIERKQENSPVGYSYI